MTTPEQPAAPTCTATCCTLPQAAGALLCAVDVRRLGDMLAQLQQEYELLSAVPSMQGREVGTIGGTTLASQRNPGRLDVIALRSRYRGTGRIGWEDADAWGLDDTPSVFSTLAGYAEQVREERDLVLPVVHVKPCLFPCMHRACLLGLAHAVPVPLTVATERRLLATHLTWIVGQEWAGEFFDDIHSLWAALRSANGQGAPRTRARCSETVGSAPCPGTVRYVDGTAMCSSCGASASGLAVVRRHTAGNAA